MRSPTWIFQGRAQRGSGRLDLRLHHIKSSLDRLGTGGRIVRYTYSPMKPLDQRLAEANELLAPYAVKHGGGLGRQHAEQEDAERFAFQRDRDRIVSTDAFRRLSRKMQVLPPTFSDHIRNRGTHTMEVANLSRTLARALGLNEDLAECIALAHDLGHPPFGHAGEEALEACADGKFEHNEQSLRIITTLAEHSKRYPGLNLSLEIIHGMQKHSGKPNHLEGQMVDIADAMTYTAHDPEDALEAEILSVQKIQTQRLGKEALARRLERGTSIRGAILEILVTDFLAETRRRIADLNIRSLQDVLSHKDPVVGFSETMRTMLHEFRDFLHAEFYNHPTVLKETSEGKRIVTDLFQAYQKNPPPKVRSLKSRTGSTPTVAVTDYIAGMTDDFAKKAHSSL